MRRLRRKNSPEERAGSPNKLEGIKAKIKQGFVVTRNNPALSYGVTALVGVDILELMAHQNLG
jgi:hypothetical protein